MHCDLRLLDVQQIWRLNVNFACIRGNLAKSERGSASVELYKYTPLPPKKNKKNAGLSNAYASICRKMFGNEHNHPPKPEKLRRQANTRVMTKETRDCLEYSGFLRSFQIQRYQFCTSTGSVQEAIRWTMPLWCGAANRLVHYASRRLSWSYFSIVHRLHLKTRIQILMDPETLLRCTA